MEEGQLETSEQPPAYEAGENYRRNKEAQILLALGKIIDFSRTDEYNQALSRAAQENREAA